MTLDYKWKITGLGRMPCMFKVTSRCPQWELNPISLNCITLVFFVTQPNSAPMSIHCKLILSVCEQEEVLSNFILRNLKERQPQQQCGRQPIQSLVVLSRESLRNQWAFESWPVLDISHVIASIISPWWAHLQRSHGDRMQGKRGKIFFQKYFWINILPDHKLGALIPRNIDKYLLTTFSCIYYNLPWSEE